MAKGTSSGDVHFSVPEGADPLGIGVLDLGRSSYDPIDTIRRFNETRRQNRLIRQDRDREDYQNFMKMMPTVSGVNKNIAANMNKDILEMSKLFKQQQSLGAFGGFAKTGEDKDEKVSIKLSEIENKVATDAPIYKWYSDQYGKDQTVMRSPANKDKIDWELTMENVDAMNQAKDVEGFSQPFAENGGSLVVFKPEPQDIIGYAKKVGSMIEGTDIMSHEIKMDPMTNTMTTTQVTGADPAMIHKAYQTGYEFAEPNMKNAIDALYNVAPDKKNADGVIMDAKEWWANKFSGFHGTTTSKKTTKLTKDTDKESTPGYGMARNEDGSLNIAQNTSTIQMAVPVDTETRTVKRTRKFGKDKGQPVYNAPQTAQAPRNVEYSTVSVPLTGFDKTYDVYSHGSAIDTETGKPIDKAKSSTHKAVRLDFIPVWRGEEKKIESETTDDSGNIVKETFTLKPGDKIPIHIQEQLQDENQSFSYEPFLLSSSVYGPAIEEKALAAGLSWEEYVSRHGKTAITPWEKANRELLVKMKASKVDPTELENLIKEINQKLNGVDDIFN